MYCVVRTVEHFSNDQECNHVSEQRVFYAPKKELACEYLVKMYTKDSMISMKPISRSTGKPSKEFLDCGMRGDHMWALTRYIDLNMPTYKGTKKFVPDYNHTEITMRIIRGNQIIEGKDGKPVLKA